MKITKCRRCPAQVRWITTPANKQMPLDPDSCEGGNVVIDRVIGHTEYGHVLKGDEIATTPTYKPHFATCPAGHKKGNT